MLRHSHCCHHCFGVQLEDGIVLFGFLPSSDHLPGSSVSGIMNTFQLLIILIIISYFTVIPSFLIHYICKCYKFIYIILVTFHLILLLLEFGVWLQNLDQFKITWIKIPALTFICDQSHDDEL